MAVYFIPKTKFISRATNININFRPKNWSRWTKRSYTTRQHHYHKNYQENNSNKGQTNFKGKLNKIQKWGAGASAGWTILSILDWWLLAGLGWLSWQGVILRWTPIGICFVAATHWHLHNRDCVRKGLPKTAPEWQTNIYCSLPLRLMSRCFGWLAECQIPENLRPLIFGLYSKTFGVNFEEALINDYKYYKNLSQFFTRSIKDDCRIISLDCLVSPCDGRVLHFGPVTSNTHLEQVKGITYSLESFFGPQQNKNTSYLESLKRKEGQNTILYHCIFYLAPGDYHRFHSPAMWKPESRRHFHGELLSVSPKIANLVPGLFCINERVAYLGQWEHGFFSFTAVGATNVGSVQVYLDNDLKTNKWRGFKVGIMNEKIFDETSFHNAYVDKGELLGQFNMGSTIVLVFEAPKTYKFCLKPNQIVKVGQSLGNFIDSDIDSGMEESD